MSVAAVSDRRTLRTPRSHPGLRERRYSAQEMFVGHYSVASAAKLERNKIPLWVLFVAVQFLDYIWVTLVLLGIEKLRVIKGLTASIAMRYLKFLLRAGAALQEDEQTSVAAPTVHHRRFPNFLFTFRVRSDKSVLKISYV